MQVLLCVIRGVNDRMLWFYVDLCGQCVFWGVCAVGGAVTVEKWCGQDFRYCGHVMLAYWDAIGMLDMSLWRGNSIFAQGYQRVFNWLGVHSWWEYPGT